MMKLFQCISSFNHYFRMLVGEGSRKYAESKGLISDEDHIDGVR